MITIMHHVSDQLALFLVLATTLVACAEPKADPRMADEPINVLTVGGGTWHDFDRWFHEEDAAILENAGALVAYVDAPADVVPALDTVDVLRLTTNQPLPEDVRRGIVEFVEAGKGLVVEHSGAWYNWEDWPRYNSEFVGGGARSHREYGSFEVHVVAPDHPIMGGVPTRFTIDDELYRFQQDPDGSSIHILATAEETETGDVYPIIWTVQHPNGRILVNTLGHDGAAHQHPAYVRILQNSVQWMARIKHAKREP